MVSLPLEKAELTNASCFFKAILFEAVGLNFVHWSLRLVHFEFTPAAMRECEIYLSS